MTTDVRTALTARAYRAVHTAAPCACPEPGTVLVDRSDSTVVRHGTVVVKAHAADTDRPHLAQRMAVAAHPALHGVLLAPLSTTTAPAHDRPVTFWPYGAPIDPDTEPEQAPWEAAGRLLAQLHRVDPAVLPAGLPVMRGPAKAARAIARLRATAPHPGTTPVLRAWRALPEWARAEAPVPGRLLCHGDFHLGQLVRVPTRAAHPDPGAAGGVHGTEWGAPHEDGAAAWRLIDVDDLGLGVPAWDLARPAAWYACGALGPDEWARFLGSYRAGGGPAVPAEGDPWPVLDVPARAVTVQSAALAVAKATAGRRPLDEVEQALVDSCDRMAGVPVVADPPVDGGRPAAPRPNADPGTGATQ